MMTLTNTLRALHVTRRRQLFEFNDLDQIPVALRESIVEALGRTLDWGRMLDGLVPTLARFYTEANVKEVLDIGSGTGAPAAILLKAFKAQHIDAPRTILTDLYPQPLHWEALHSAHADHIDFIPSPVDATRIESHLGAHRARQFINIFHHLPEEIAYGVLEDAVRGRHPLFITEAFTRRPLQFLNFALAGVPSLYINPLLAPHRRLEKALWTWLTPVALSACVWDGLVSTLRIYEPTELRTMLHSIEGSEDYSWRQGTFRYPPAGEGFYLYGVPRRRAQGRGESAP